MNKVVTRHYPAKKLPKDLRGDIPPDAMVEIIVSEESRDQPNMHALRNLLTRAPRREGGMEESVDRIRKLRDEWDD